jgi:hypothetical protein
MAQVGEVIGRRRPERQFRAKSRLASGLQLASLMVLTCVVASLVSGVVLAGVLLQVFSAGH